MRINFSHHLSRVTTLPENTLAYRHLQTGDCEKTTDAATDWRLTNSSIPWNFQYWLVCL